jgi:hypothetical protein
MVRAGLKLVCRFAAAPTLTFAASICMLTSGARAYGASSAPGKAKFSITRGGCFLMLPRLGGAGPMALMLWVDGMMMLMARGVSRVNTVCSSAHTNFCNIHMYAKQ